MANANVELDYALNILNVARRSELVTALASANIFETIALGLASGETYFSVPSDAEDEYLILYKVTAGAAVEVDRYPNVEGVLNARDAAEAYAAGAASVAAEVDADRIASQQAAIDAGDAAQVKVDAHKTALALPGGGAGVGVVRSKPLRQAIKTANQMLSGQIVYLWEFADKAIGYVANGNPADWDWSPAIAAAFDALTAFPAIGGSGTVYTGPTDLSVSVTVRVPFGGTLLGNGSDLYASRIRALPGFVGEAVVVVDDSGPSYINGNVSRISVDTRNLSGVGGIHFYGASRNSSIRDVVVTDVAYNAHGLLVTPKTGTSTPVCESMILENVYVIKNRTQAHTKPGIFLNKLQESVLTNVKSFHSGNPATPLGGDCMELRDCRGIVVNGGGFVGGDHGIAITSVTRASHGIQLNMPTMENLAVADVRILGNASFNVERVVGVIRREYPSPDQALIADYVTLLDIDIAGGNYTLGDHINGNVCIRGNGGGTATVSAATKYNSFSYGNAVIASFRMGPSLIIESVNTPFVGVSVKGRTGQYRFEWNGSDVTDGGGRIRSPGGLTLFTFSDVGAVAKLGFYGQAAIAKPTVTGSHGGNAASKNTTAALALLGLIVDSTTL